MSNRHKPYKDQNRRLVNKKRKILGTKQPPKDLQSQKEKTSNDDCLDDLAREAVGL